MQPYYNYCPPMLIPLRSTRSIERPKSSSTTGSDSVVIRSFDSIEPLQQGCLPLTPTSKRCQAARIAVGRIFDQSINQFIDRLNQSTD